MASTLAWASPGEVTLPLDAWAALNPTPPVADDVREHAPVDRRLTGTTERGLFEGTLVTRFHTLHQGGALMVPVIGTDTTVSQVRLDGRPTTLVRDGDTWSVAVTGAGLHTVVVGLLHGRQTDRFPRRLTLQLPPGGPTAIDVVLPESPIDAFLTDGVIAEQREHPDGTALRGWLGADGGLDLTWERRATHANGIDARLDVTVDALIEVGEDVVVGVEQITFAVLDGQTDRLDLQMPAGVEILDVTGDHVMQWHTDTDSGLAVLLRSVVDDTATTSVRYQYPAPNPAEIPIRVVTPVDAASLKGTVGITAPVVLAVALGEVAVGRVLQPRDVPQTLVALTDAPLRASVAFDADPPEAMLSVTRQAEVQLSSSRIDDLQGISVLVEDGTQVGKVRLAVRNTSRQVLALDLPPGARLTHCFRDGVPLRPAADPDRPDRVLIPLTRSARVGGPAAHEVVPGDTLSGIALAHFGDASRWPRIQEANPELHAVGLQPGMVLTLPGRDEDQQEQSFVLELGFKLDSDPVAPVGRRTLALPRLDLEVMAANWHVYLPPHVEPLSIDSNLVQQSQRRLGPWQRIVHLVASAPVGPRPAFAGGDSTYRNVLSARRQIYADQKQQHAVADAGDPFPLVGRQIRFRGVLLGTDPPMVTLSYLTRPVADVVRAAFLLLSAILAGWLARSPRGRTARGAGVVGLGLGVWVGSFVLGVHGRILWGICIGLATAAMIRLGSGARARPRWVDAVAIPIAMFVGVCAPDLFPVVLAAVLVQLHRRSS